MTSKIKTRTIHWLLAAGLAFGAAAAQAAGGVSMTQSDETKVAVGMTASEVQQNLGRAADIVQYRTDSGPTWIYEVEGAPFGRTEFDIEFGPDGKVTSASEIVLGDH